MRELARAAAFCTRYEAPAALVYFDLDGFKSVNDRFGHAAGDRVLEAVARGLLDHVRESDVVARLGGDEFAVLLAQAEREAALAKARALQAELEREPVIVEPHVIALRLSAGVRAFEPGLTPARWLAEADAAMFLQKGSSR
jgi:diguanylate cyclase (GGDEF)-like protein